MKKILLIIITLINYSITNAQQVPKVDEGTIVRIENFKSKYIESRTIDIWLPDGYNKKNTYAVLYMQDGQMLYDSNITWNKKSWEIDKRVNKLLKDRKIKNTIVVGIWNGDKKRHSEYFPQKPFENLSAAEKDTIKNAVRNNYASVFNNYQINSDNYLKFIVKELKPIIDMKFSTKKNRENTIIGGSSMGGLISMYAICEYPNVFGGAICMSTHWPGIFAMDNNPIPNAFINYLDLNLPNPKTHKIYFDHGDQTLDALYPKIQVKVDEVMKKKGFNESNWMTRFFEGQNHSENAWSSRVQIPLLFMLSNK
jgi:predicted alpha/beta superfamily hydrolase